MSKKGSALPVETIAVIILILLVLVVLAIVFREQIAQLFSSFGNILKDTNKTVSTINISSLI
jgi:Na+-driven multidrug efflux pump